MGTDGGSEADTGRGTHRRSRLPTPHLAHLAPPHSQQLLRKNKNFAFFGGFWRAEAGWSWRNGPGAAVDVAGAARAQAGADCAVGSG